jgi:hypothetical protein
VICSGDVIVTVGLQTLNRVVCLEVVFIYYLPQKVSIEGHFLKSWVKSWFAIRWETRLLKPRMLSNGGNGCSLLRVCVKDLRKKITTLVRYEFRDLVVGTQDLLVQLGSFRIFKRQIPTNHCVKHNSWAPYISLETVITFASDHLYFPKLMTRILPQERRSKGNRMRFLRFHLSRTYYLGQNQLFWASYHSQARDFPVSGHDDRHHFCEDTRSQK